MAVGAASKRKAKELGEKEKRTTKNKSPSGWEPPTPTEPQKTATAPAASEGNKRKKATPCSQRVKPKLDSEVFNDCVDMSPTQTTAKSAPPECLRGCDVDLLVRPTT